MIRVVHLDTYRVFYHKPSHPPYLFIEQIDINFPCRLRFGQTQTVTRVRVKLLCTTPGLSDDEIGSPQEKVLGGRDEEWTE